METVWVCGEVFSISIQIQWGWFKPVDEVLWGTALDKSHFLSDFFFHFRQRFLTWWLRVMCSGKLTNDMSDVSQNWLRPNSHRASSNQKTVIRRRTIAVAFCVQTGLNCHTWQWALRLQQTYIMLRPFQGILYDSIFIAQVILLTKLCWLNRVIR